jgi:hypothetical protein
MPDVRPTSAVQSDVLVIPVMTLWQPWACLIELGFKPYETRGKQPPKRLMGQRIGIHAAMRKPRHSDVTDEEYEAISDCFGFCNYPEMLPRGVVVCTAILSDAKPAEQVPHDLFGDYRPGRWAWKLDDVRPIEPHVPAKGKQTWGWTWTVPAGVKI